VSNALIRYILYRKYHTRAQILYSFALSSVYLVLPKQYTHVSGMHPDVHTVFSLAPAFAFPYRWPILICSATVYYTNRLQSINTLHVVNSNYIIRPP